MEKDFIKPIISQVSFAEKPKYLLNNQILNSNNSDLSNSSSKNAEEEHSDSFIISGTTINKAKAKSDIIQKLPSYVERGLEGDPNFNFYEFMQIAKIPYFLGGPGLVATILAGQNLFDIRANKAAKFNAKGMALGCLFYYVMMEVAKKCVDIPVKFFRGVDLNQPLVVKVNNKTETPSGKSKQKIEQHNLFESSKFIRWDLLYQKDSKNPKEINSKYTQIAKKMEIPEDVNDSDTAVKPLIMELIKQSRAWKYIIGAFAVMLGVSLGNQKIMKEEFCTGLMKGFKQNNTNLPLTSKIKNTLTFMHTKITEPLKDSFISLWKGTENSPASKYTGKFAIAGFLTSILLANISILKSTNKKETKFEKEQEVNN
jgi:hypothetical protein